MSLNARQKRHVEFAAVIFAVVFLSAVTLVVLTVSGSILFWSVDWIGGVGWRWVGVATFVFWAFYGAAHEERQMRKQRELRS